MLINSNRYKYCSILYKSIWWNQAAKLKLSTNMIWLSCNNVCLELHEWEVIGTKDYALSLWRLWRGKWRLKHCCTFSIMINLCQFMNPVAHCVAFISQTSFLWINHFMCYDSCSGSTERGSKWFIVIIFELQLAEGLERYRADYSVLIWDVYHQQRACFSEEPGIIQKTSVELG